MKKILKSVTDNWFVFFGYLSLFLLTVIAALQIYDANYKITGKYKELTNKDNAKLTLLFKSRQNLGDIRTITIRKVLHSPDATNTDEWKLNQLLDENDRNLNQYTKLIETQNERSAFTKLLQAWDQDKNSSRALIALQTSREETVRYYQSIQDRSYENLQRAISSLSLVLIDETKIEEAAADAYFKKSIAFINILIGIRVAILIIIGIIILKVVARIRIKNKVLQQTQTELLQNQAHLLASQQISKTGSWEFGITESRQIDKNTLTWSDETYRIFGYEPGEVKVTGELFYSHVHKNDQGHITNAIQKSVETGIPYYIEHKIILRNGETKIVCGRSDIFYDANGKPLKMIGTCQDITEQKLGEQKLAEAEREKHRLKDQINKQKINRQREITRATITAQEKERLELGKELHDNVNQILSTSKLFIESAMHNPERQTEMLNRSTNLINSSIEELRKLSRFLAPPSLGDLTLRESIEEIVEEYNQIDGRKTIEYEIVDLDEDKLSDDLKISVYRIIQEQLNNIRKHAQASKVRMQLKHGSNSIALHIEDNGCGFDILAKRKGLGITNIINRAETFNGGVQIVSSHGKGCAMYVSFKLHGASIVNISATEKELEQKLYGTGS